MHTSSKDKVALEDAGGELLPFEESIGYQVRATHRLISLHLQQMIAPYSVTLGMWYFLRALWHEDGLTQRELSNVVGTMEPTTLTAIKSMEAKGLVRRHRNSADARKINIFLTDRGRSLRKELLPIAKRVVEDAVEGFSDSERTKFLRSLKAIQANLSARLEINEVGRQE